MFKAPRQLPPLQTLTADIGQPAPDVIARALGVHVRTVYTWQARGQAPRPAHLALFWESSWGRSVIAADAVNLARWSAGEVAALRAENAALRAQVERLQALGSFGSANAPILAAQPVSGPRRAVL